MKKSTGAIKTALMSITIVIGVATSISAQILHPVHWTYAAKKISAYEAVIFLKADINDDWHIYSVFQKDGGPVRTSFVFLPSAAYSLDGGLIEPQPVVKYEKTFEMNVSYFEKEVVFQQKVHLKAKQVEVKGSLNYMVCNDLQCLPPETVNFSVAVK